MAFTASPDIVAEVGLIYVHDDMAGISRKRSGKGFAYLSPNGQIIKDAAILDRIKKLAIPPAYENVWICPLDNGHIQATGRDARGRKQYRYHSAWIELSSGNKFSHMLDFGSSLPLIRDRVDSDLCKKGLPREKVLATVVWFLEKSLIRVGNEEYAKENNHYGLTTMKMRHCKVDGATIQFHFVGKRGIKHDIAVSDRRMARLVRKIQELPGQELFQYLDDEGNCHSISSADVNAYLKEITDKDFTAKDFRTWSATVLALCELSCCCGFNSDSQAKRLVTAAMRAVSNQLGNTPAICRKSYVHPGIVNAYLDGSLEKFLERKRIEIPNSENGLSDCAEAAALKLLHELELQGNEKAA